MRLHRTTVDFPGALFYFTSGRTRVKYRRPLRHNGGRAQKTVARRSFVPLQLFTGFSLILHSLRETLVSEAFEV